MRTTTEELKQSLLVKKERPQLNSEGALSTGSTLLNLACTEHPAYGFLKGGYYYLVGDSASGKTWLSMTCFAEACLSPAFKDYELIFDDVEGGALMDIEKYFGKAVLKRMRAPAYHKGRPINSDTVESFYYHLDNLVKEKKKFIYVLDSQDALTSESSNKKFNKQKKAAEESEEVKGSYGDGKAKYHSENIRRVISKLRRYGCILIIIGQTRDNLGMGFEKKTRAGGKSLRFYANLEIWTSVFSKIKKFVREKERTVGALCMAEVKKNRLTGKVGKDRSVQIPIFYELGIDDVGSCVDFLISEKHWRKVKQDGVEIKKKIYNARDILFKGGREKIIAYIEEEGLEKKVRELTAKVWREIEEECAPHRKRRYE